MAGVLQASARAIVGAIWLVAIAGAPVRFEE